MRVQALEVGYFDKRGDWHALADITRRAARGEINHACVRGFAVITSRSNWTDRDVVLALAHDWRDCKSFPLVTEISWDTCKRWQRALIYG